MNFFLYSLRTPQGDFLVRDRLVEVTLDRPYTKEFDQLALFAFHLANSGSWQGSKWKDGHVAGWANELIRGTAWRDGRWIDAAFQEASLAEFLQSRLDGEPSTKRKILTNYRFMLKSAGVLVDGKLQQLNLRQRWFVDAVQLFWDRQIFDGSLPTSSNASAFEESFLENEIYKLFGCDESQGVAFVRAALPEYLSDRLGERVEQLN